MAGNEEPQKTPVEDLSLETLLAYREQTLAVQEALVTSAGDITETLKNVGKELAAIRIDMNKLFSLVPRTEKDHDSAPDEVPDVHIDRSGFTPEPKVGPEPPPGSGVVDGKK